MSCNKLIQWESFPFKERPLTSIFLVLFLIVLSMILWAITVNEWKSPIFYYGGMVLVIANLLPYFIPTYYTLYESKIEIRYLILKINRFYSDFGCFYLDKRGIMLSTFKIPRRLDVFRGQSLRFSKDQSERQEVIKILQEKIGSIS